MTQYRQLFHEGRSNDLRVHLGNLDSTLVSADHWITPDRQFDKRLSRYPDLMVAFDVDLALYEANEGYVISEQGKPPDFVLEVASESTGRVDVTEKRTDYAALGIPEYWRFDETGKYHGAKLSGDRLADGEYVPIETEELPDGSLQGYSAVLNLHLRWMDGTLAFYDPATGEAIASLESERARAESERQAREAAEARAETERVRADSAEARVRELEERLRGQGA